MSRVLGCTDKILESECTPLVFLTARRAEAYIHSIVCNIEDRGPQSSQTVTVMMQAYTSWKWFGNQVLNHLFINLGDCILKTRFNCFPPDY
jgi:hypothetical protein